MLCLFVYNNLLFLHYVNHSIDGLYMFTLFYNRLKSAYDARFGDLWYTLFVPDTTLKIEYGRNRNTKTQLVASPVNKDRATASPLYKDMAQLPGNPLKLSGGKKMKEGKTVYTKIGTDTDYYLRTETFCPTCGQSTKKAVCTNETGWETRTMTMHCNCGEWYKYTA